MENYWGALNFIGEDTLYGRNWGADIDIPNLHLKPAIIGQSNLQSTGCSVWKQGQGFTK